MQPPAQIAAPYFRQVCTATGIKPETLIGNSVDNSASKARQSLTGLLYQLTDLTPHQIGELINRDHTTVYYSMDRVRARCGSDPGYARHYRQLLGGRATLRPLPEPGSKGGTKRRPIAPPKTGDCVPTVSAATHGRLDQLHYRSVETKLKEARESLAYWTMKKAQSIADADQQQAAARILLWTGEVTACERRLRELNRAEALTA